MKNLFEKINKFDLNNPKHDLLTYGEKAIAYIEHIARMVQAWDAKYVQNSARIITAFPNDYNSINKEVGKIEAFVRGLMRDKNENNCRLPSPDVFRGGTIVFGKIPESNVEVRLAVSQFSGNVVIYGQYGMGKTNLNLLVIPQLASQGVHVDVFDVTNDYRDIVLVPECKAGVVLDHQTDRLNPLEPEGLPDDHLQFLWEITSQDFRIHDETKEMLFNYSAALYKEFGVYEGKEPPTLLNLRDRLIADKSKKETPLAIKRKIETALKKLTYILTTFGKMVDCKRGYSLHDLDAHPIVIREVSMLSEDKRSWYIKLNLRRFYYKGLVAKERHKVKRAIVIDEAKAIFGKSVIGEASNFTKDTFTKSRSKGDAYIISDQFATELANFTRAANCQLVLHHTVPADIREISTAMAGDDSMKLDIPRLGKFKAFMKITDFQYPFPVVLYKSKVEAHVTDTELLKLMKNKLEKLAYTFQSHNKEKRVRVIENSIGYEKASTKVRVVSTNKKNVLGDLERFLKYVKENPESKVTDIYHALNLSGRKGNNLKFKARENELIIEKRERKEGKGRPSIKLELTEKGREYLNEKQ